jgi:hypothetical protein
MTEYSNLPEGVQNKILDILWGQVTGTKETCMGEVDEWIADGDCDWTPEEWIEEAKNAGL